MFGRGKKKQLQQRAQDDGGQPQGNMAFMEEIKFDDKELEAELRAMGWQDEGDTSRSAGSTARGNQGRRVPPAPPHAALYDDDEGEVELTEDDLNDPNLMAELGDMIDGSDYDGDGGDSGIGNDYDGGDDGSFSGSHTAIDGGGSNGGGEDDPEEFEAPREPPPPQTRTPPPRQPLPALTTAPSARPLADELDETETQALEAAVAAQKQRALSLKRAGDSDGAVAAMREARIMEGELQVKRTLVAVATVAVPVERRMAAASGSGWGSNGPPPPPPRRGSGSGAVAGGSASAAFGAAASERRLSAGAAAAAMGPRGSAMAAAADSGGGGAGGQQQQQQQQPPPQAGGGKVGAPNERAAVVAQLQEQTEAHKRRALELKKEGRTVEALNHIKRAKAIEGDLARLADGIGGGGGGGGTFSSNRFASSNSSVDDGSEAGDLRVPGLRRGRSSNGGLVSGAANNVGFASNGYNSSSGGAAAAATAAAVTVAAMAAAAVPAPTPARQRQHSTPPPPPAVQQAGRAGSGGLDLFNPLEEALKVAARAHLDRARVLLATDRVAAAAEKRKVEDIQVEMARLREVRTIPGAIPPDFHWEMTRKNRIRTIKEVGMEEIELSLGKVTGLSGKLGGRKNGTVFVVFDLGMSKDKATGVGVSRDVAAADDEADFDFAAKFPLKRSKSTQLAFSHRKASFEVMRRKALWGQEAVAKAIVPLTSLLTSCEIAVHTPLLSDGRREIGGTMEVRLRLCKPIQSDEVTVVEEKELVVGPWHTAIRPASIPRGPPQAAAPRPSAPLPPAAAGAANAPRRSPSPPAAAAAASVAPAAAPAAVPGSSAAVGSAVPAAASAAAAAAAADGGSLSSADTARIVLTEDEKKHPLAPENIDSNNVLEAEIEAMGTPTAPEQMLRKAMLERKLLCLVAAVQSGELTLDQYLDMIRVRMERDRLLAVWLKSKGQLTEAKAVARRITAMREELETAPDNEEEASG